MLSFREAQIDDLDALFEMRLLNADFHTSINPDNTLMENARDHFYTHSRKTIEEKDHIGILAFEKDQMVGYGIGMIGPEHPVFDHGIVGLIDDIYVVEGLQGKGIGKQIVQEMIEWFKARDVSKIDLTVHSPNHQGKAFWESLGFEIEMYKMIRRI